VCLGACVLLRVCVSTKVPFLCAHLKASAGLNVDKHVAGHYTISARASVGRALRSPCISTFSLLCISSSLFILFYITSSLSDYHSVMRGEGA